MITGLAHVAIKVTDLAAALGFYCDGIGLQHVFDLRNEAGEIWLSYLAAGQGTFVELFPKGRKDSGEREDRAGLHHLCLRVDDMRRTLEELRERGLPVAGEATRGEDGNLQYWLHDPDGNPVELMEIAPNSLQAEAIGS
jgi:lactoylglutathione lyase